jgi:hypothetical protein
MSADAVRAPDLTHPASRWLGDAWSPNHHGGLGVWGAAGALSRPHPASKEAVAAARRGSCGSPNAASGGVLPIWRRPSRPSPNREWMISGLGGRSIKE